MEQLVKPFETLTDDERMFIVRRARFNKYVAKPAYIAKLNQETSSEEKTVERKAKTKAKASKASFQKTLDLLTPEQKAELIRSLQS